MPDFLMFSFFSNVFSALSGGKSLDPVLVSELMSVFDEHNKLTKIFRMVRDFRVANENVPVKLRLFRNRRFDSRVYNVPEIDEVAALIVGDFDSSEDGRDIVVREKDGMLQRIHETHSKYIPLQYPVLFPFGEDQYEEHIERNVVTKSGTVKKRVRVSLREFMAFRLVERSVENAVIFQGKKLLHQFIVDCYSMVEMQRLSYIRSNQGSIRSGFLTGIEEAVERGDIDASDVGARTVLPASFTGGRRYVFNNCQDAMAICKRFGYPDLFLTFTCNPKWVEIQRHLDGTGNYAAFRPDIVCRLFRLKLEEMMRDFKNGEIFGRVIAG